EWSNAQSLTPEKLKRFTPDVGWQVSYDVLRHSRGSRADVNAHARFRKTGWVLEMTRELSTGHGDDLPLDDPSIPYFFGVAIHDGSAGSGHAVSGPVRLEFLKSR
ncbi:MAG: ethylbenzene dehydrogenase-related protein, partial [Planctomycetota bacterium]